MDLTQLERDLRAMIGDLPIAITHFGRVIAASSDDLMLMNSLIDGTAGYQRELRVELTAIAADFVSDPEAEDDIIIEYRGKSVRGIIDEINSGQDGISYRLRIRVNHTT